MLTIVIASRKGGSAKSMLARHIAVEALRSNAGKVAMIDVDPMKGLTQWWEARSAPEPLLIDSSTGLPAAFATAIRMEVSILIIDTPPSIGDIVSEAINLSDIVLVPVQPSSDDLRAVGSTVELAKKSRKPLVFVITRTKPRARLTGQAAILLSQHGTVAPIQIADRTIYAASGTDGRTAPELDAVGEAAKEIAGLWDYVVQRMTEIHQ